MFKRCVFRARRKAEGIMLVSKSYINRETITNVCGPIYKIFYDNLTIILR